MKKQITELIEKNPEVTNLTIQHLKSENQENSGKRNWMWKDKKKKLINKNKNFTYWG